MLATVLNTTATTLNAPPFDFTRLIQPLPEGARFADPDYHIWCSSMVRDRYGRCHLFYSRWPRALGHYAWATHSEVARAEADNPFGPFRHVATVLPARHADYWDGACTHNPTVIQYGSKYYLYYMGLNASANFNHTISMDDPAWWIYRNRQRIGVAVADNPSGPWQRFDQPCIDVSTDHHAPDSLMVSNPAITPMPDGRFLAIYKAVGKAQPLPNGGPVVHLAAIAATPTGPFVKSLKPIFSVDGCNFPAEDPYIWYQQSHDKYYAIVKDMHGNFTGKGQSLALFQSTDGLDWEQAPQVLVTDLELRMENGEVERFCNLERPQLWHENGQPRALFLAAAKDLSHSFNLHLPLIGPDS